MSFDRLGAVHQDADTNALVFSDLLALETERVYYDSATETAVPAITVSSGLMDQGARQGPPSEESPLRPGQQVGISSTAGPDGVGQIGPRPPSKTICGFGAGAFILISAAMVLAVSLSTGLLMSILYGPSQIKPTGAVASSSQQCSDIGLAILNNKGTAAEAVVAMALCLGVVRPDVAGLGGDAMAIIHNHRIPSIQGQLMGRAMSPDNLQDLLTIPKFDPYRLTGWAVGLPLQFALLVKLFDDHNNEMKWSDILKPVSNLARQGYKLEQETIDLMKSPLVNLDTLKSRLSQNPNISKAFFDQFGAPLPVGSLIQRPDLADFFDTLATQPGDNPKNLLSFFYAGTAGQNMISAMNKVLPDGKTSTLFSRFDVPAAMQELPRQPVSSSRYKEFELLYPGMPSAGVLVAETLGILDKANLSSSDYASSKFYDVLVEASKFAAVDIAQSGGYGVNVSGLVNPSYLSNLGQEVSTPFHKPGPNWSVYNSQNWQKAFPLGQTETGSVFVAALDSDELFVALTMSLGSPFGAMIGTSDGFLLNNHMEAFVYGPENQLSPNAIKANKAPLSAQAPMVAHVPNSCHIRLAIGASIAPTKNLSMDPNSAGWWSLISTAESLARLLDGSSTFDSINAWRVVPSLANFGNWSGDATELFAESNQTLSNNPSDFLDAPPAIISGLSRQGHILQSMDAGSLLSGLFVVDKQSDSTGATADQRYPSAMAENF